MKFKPVYREINSILELVGQKPIKPLDNCNDNKKQFEHLYDRYLDLYLTQFPKWKPFRDKPEQINDIGVQALLKFKNAT